MPPVAGIVLAGGRSSRMGRPKATLEWHGTSLLAHVASVLRLALDGPIVVVCAPGQHLPALPTTIEVAEDRREGRGPLEGIAAGLRAVADRAEAAYASATDVPFLQPAFVRRIVAALEGDPGADAAVPLTGGRMHPLAAAYRTSIIPRVDELLAADRLRATVLFAELETRWLDENELLGDPEVRAADPALESLRNLNTPAEYEAALARGRPPKA